MRSKHKIIKLQIAINAVSEQKVAKIQKKKKKKPKTQLDIVSEISQCPPREYAPERVGLVRTHEQYHI